MGAYDEFRSLTNPSGTNAAKESNPIDKYRSAQSALDKALANPKTSMSTLNKLTNNLANTLSAAIDYKPSNSNNNLGTSLINDNYAEDRVIAPTPPTPQQPVTPQTPQTPQTQPVKTASIDTVLFWWWNNANRHYVWFNIWRHWWTRINKYR